MDQAAARGAPLLGMHADADNAAGSTGKEEVKHIRDEFFFVWQYKNQR